MYVLMIIIYLLSTVEVIVTDDCCTVKEAE